MNDLQIFGFEGREVRVIVEKGEPWFVAKDVAEVLGYVWNGKACIAHVPEEWRGVRSVLTPSGIQEMNCLSEQGLYFFLGRSDKSNALPFQKLVAGTILPTIRKTGSYTVPGREQKPIPAARIKEIRLAYDKGTVTVNEYRRQAFNLPPFAVDGPLERPGKGKVQKAEPEEKYRPSDELLKFADENIEFTGNPNDFVRLPDLYDRYILKVENPLSRWSFIYTLKGAFSLISRQKRLGGYPTHVFIGCKFKEIRS
jgi:prophage antirepressor-like protein